MGEQYSSIQYSWLSRSLPRLMTSASRLLPASPTSIQIDGNEVAPQQISEQLVANAKSHLIANWDISVVTQLSVEQPDTLRLNQQFELPRIPEVLAWLCTLDFDVCIGGPLFSDWQKSAAVNVLFPGQYPLGWMLALKGKGVDYLSSRRWLDQAPVRIHQADDVVLIQFHDLLADSATALAQARQGWPWFNRSPESGFLGGVSKKGKFDGQYNSLDHGLYISVLGREPTLDELREVAYCKNFLEMDDGRPIDKVVYLFFDPIIAKKWLHELWIRGIECRTFIEGKEVILSDNYAPPPNKNISW